MSLSACSTYILSKFSPGGDLYFDLTCKPHFELRPSMVCWHAHHVVGAVILCPHGLPHMLELATNANECVPGARTSNGSVGLGRVCFVVTCPTEMFE